MLGMIYSKDGTVTVSKAISTVSGFMVFPV